MKFVKFWEGEVVPTGLSVKGKSVWSWGGEERTRVLI
jgi:hypothetical protein